MKLRNLLKAWCPNRKVALSTLGAWIAGNAFIGAQLSWILRPFFGSPGLEVAFLRDHPMRDGGFYEAVWRSFLRILDASGISLIPAILITLLAALIIGPLIHSQYRSQPQTPTP